MFKFIIATAFALFHQIPAFASEIRFQSWPEACSRAEQAVAEGDLIFLDIPNRLFREVAKSTRSWTSHVGVVVKNPAGQWRVAEGAVPLSQELALCDFLKKSSPYKLEIRRLGRPLGPVEISTMKTTAQSMLGQPYDLGFNFDSRKTFCSKFVYLVYRSVGIEVGKIQSFQDLLAENPQSSLGFWRLWFLGRIPFERRTVTPASQLVDSKFTTVLDGH